MPTLPNPAEARPKLVEALKLDLLGLHLSGPVRKFTNVFSGLGRQG